MDIFIIYMMISVVIGCLLASLIIKLITIIIKFILVVLKKEKPIKDKKHFDELLQNSAFKIELAPSNNYTQEQIDIVDLQEKLEKLQARIEELKKKKP